jgi:DUF4097 and DUF4098 domain-containing protein YvlB
MVKTIALLVCLAPALLSVRVEEKQTIRKTFPAAARIEVDNVNGAVSLKGSDTREIRVTAYETISADTQDRIAQARSEVKVEMTEENNKLRVYVDGPFRGRSSGRRDYKARYDIEIEAPRDSAIWLRTVNGKINVANVAAGYDVESVNGRVDLLDLAGSGRAYSLNGGVKATFRANPREASYFGALNGQVEVCFQPGLSADVSVKTFNGQVYSDFPFTALPAAAASVERRGGTTVYRANRSMRVRIASGGPEIKLESFNGNISILSEGLK